MFSPLKSKVGFQARQPIADSATNPAPVGGLNTRDSLAAMKPIYATVLVNWFPAEKQLELRKGATEWATGLPSQPKHLAVWQGTASAILLAFCDTGIFNATAAGAVGAASSVITNGDCVTLNYTTTGGSFLFVANGTDDIRYFNGATWTTTASYSISGGGTLNSNTIAHVSSFKRSLYFIPENSMSFYYLPVDSIAGTVSAFPLGALFSEGGYLMAMGNWTVDGGAGIDDYAVFITSEGQAAIYQGTDPSSATTWQLKGVYNIGKPLGRKCFEKVGGDLVALTALGVTSLSKVLASGMTNEKTTLTDIISSKFQYYAKLYGAVPGWKVVANPSINLMIVNIPTGTSGGSFQLARNIITGAWTEFNGWDTLAWTIDSNQLYMADGTAVQKAWTDSDDYGSSIRAYAKTAWMYLNPRSRKKHIKAVRPMLRIGGRVSVNVALDTDFADGLEYTPAFSSPGPQSRFDSGTFDDASWGELPVMKIDWLTVANAEGYCSAMRLRVIGSDSTVEWTATDYAYESGGIIG